MTDADTREGEPPTDDAEDERLRALLKGALTGEEPPNSDVLAGVQKKLRQRSRGKFYGDAWSTDRNPPIGMFLVTSALMLVVILFVWALLGPLSGDPAPVDVHPEPVHVVAPRHSGAN